MKFKVIGMVVATCFFIVIIVLAYVTMWPEERQGGSEMMTEYSNTNEETQVLQANEVLYNSFAELQKTNENYTALLINSAKEAEIEGAEKEVSQAEESFKKIIDKVEVSNLKLQNESAKKSLAQIISAYRLLLRFQSFENMSSNKESSTFSAEPQTEQLQNDLSGKTAKIAQLEKQVKLLKSGKNNILTKTVTLADYEELVMKNKYLNFDLRSVIVTNLNLTKEYEALKKTNQELNNQLRQLKNN